MIERTKRALGSALLAAAMAGAIGGAAAPAMAEDGQVLLVQDGAELKKRADLLLEGIRSGGSKVSHGAIEAGPSPEGVVIKAIEVVSPDGRKATIDQVTVRSFDWANPKEPRFVDLQVAKLSVAVDALDRDAREGFADLGLTQLTVNGELAYRFVEAEKAFEVTRLVFDFVDLGELRLRLKLTGVTPEDVKAATGDQGKAGKPPAGPGAGGDQMMGVLSRLNVAGAAISFKDKSLVERWVRSEAKKKSMSEQAAKTKLIEEMSEVRSKAEDEVTREILDAAIRFVRTPGEIELAANPPAPANVMAAFMTVMGNRATFKQLIGLTVMVR